MGKMIQCKNCSKEIAANAKSCPECGAKNKKAIYKRPWFIVVLFFIIVGVASSMDEDKSNTTDSSSKTIAKETTENENAENQNTAENTEKKEEVVEEKVPTEYKSALRKAKTYSDTMHMSKAGVYNQLTSEYGEKFTAEEAQYAIDNLQ